MRDVALPPGEREEDISASYKDGILEVHIPMPEERGPETKKIPISKE